MRSEQDAMILVRADLCERLETLKRLSVQKGGDVASAIANLRGLAAAYGLCPVVRLAEALERAVKGDTGKAMVPLYFERLRDAIGCDPADEQASDSMLASISIRLDG